MIWSPIVPQENWENIMDSDRQILNSIEEEQYIEDNIEDISAPWGSCGSTTENQLEQGMILGYETDPETGNDELQVVNLDEYNNRAMRNTSFCCIKQENQQEQKAQDEGQSSQDNNFLGFQDNAFQGFHENKFQGFSERNFQGFQDNQFQGFPSQENEESPVVPATNNTDVLNNIEVISSTVNDKIEQGTSSKDSSQNLQEEKGPSSKDSSRSSSSLVQSMTSMFNRSPLGTVRNLPRRLGLRSSGPVPDQSWVLNAGDLQNKGKNKKS